MDQRVGHWWPRGRAGKSIRVFSFLSSSRNLILHRAVGNNVVPVARRLAAMVSTLHRWFAIHRDSLRVAFECDERLPDGRGCTSPPFPVGPQSVPTRKSVPGMRLLPSARAPCPAGSREGRIVLVQFAVKRRGRERRPVHRQEVLLAALGAHRATRVRRAGACRAACRSRSTAGNRGKAGGRCGRSCRASWTLDRRAYDYEACVNVTARDRDQGCPLSPVESKSPFANGLEITEVAAAVQDSSDLEAVRSGTKKDHVHTDRHTAASSDPESRS